jgi:hypothetical protein
VRRRSGLAVAVAAAGVGAAVARRRRRETDVEIGFTDGTWLAVSAGTPEGARVVAVARELATAMQGGA